MITNDLHFTLNLSPRMVKQHKGKNSRFLASWQKMFFFIAVQPNNHFSKMRKNLREKKNIARVERALKGSSNSIPSKQHIHMYVYLQQSNDVTEKFLFQFSQLHQEACMVVGMILLLPRGIPPFLLTVLGNKHQVQELKTRLLGQSCHWHLPNNDKW